MNALMTTIYLLEQGCRVSVEKPREFAGGANETGRYRGRWRSHHGLSNGIFFATARYDKSNASGAINEGQSHCYARWRRLWGIVDCVNQTLRL
jgi:hypothetical protein